MTAGISHHFQTRILFFQTVPDGEESKEENDMKMLNYFHFMWKALIKSSVLATSYCQGKEKKSEYQTAPVIKYQELVNDGSIC